MKNWKIGTRITAGFGVVIVIAMALGVFAYNLIGTIENSAAKITGAALPGLYLVAQIQNAVHKNFAETLTLVAAKDPQEVARLVTDIQSARVKNSGLLADYENTIVTAKGREIYESVKAARGVYSNALNVLLQLKRDSKDREAIALLEGQLKPANAKYVEAMTDLMAFRKSFSDERSNAIEGTVATARTGIQIGLVVSLFIAGFVTWVIVRVSQPRSPPLWISSTRSRSGTSLTRRR